MSAGDKKRKHGENPRQQFPRPGNRNSNSRSRDYVPIVIDPNEAELEALVELLNTHKQLQPLSADIVTFGNDNAHLSVEKSPCWTANQNASERFFETEEGYLEGIWL
jgi:hypothetical protein